MCFYKCPSCEAEMNQHDKASHACPDTTNDFTTAARAEANRRHPVRLSNVHMPEDIENAMMQGVFLTATEWARTHLAAQEPTDAEIEAVAVLLYRQRALHHTMESWGREPETVKNLYRLDARAALVTARDTRTARRDQEKR